MDMSVDLGDPRLVTRHPAVPFALLAALAALVLVIAAACGGGDEPAQATPTPDAPPTPESTPVVEGVIAGPVESVSAPIRDITIESVSDPANYTVFVISAQTTDCEAFEGVGPVVRDGRFVRLIVTNLRSIDPGRTCNEALSTRQSRVEIGSNYIPGETYTVVVNGFPKDFTVPGGSPTPVPPTPEPTVTPVPIGPVTAERVTVLLQEVATTGIANFRVLVLAKTGEFAVGATVTASLQGPVGSDNLRSPVLDVVTDDKGIADFRFPIEEAGSFVFTVEFIFGTGAVFDQEGSKEFYVFTDIPSP
jgi:hypothetical protein